MKELAPRVHERVKPETIDATFELVRGIFLKSPHRDRIISPVPNQIDWQDPQLLLRISGCHSERLLGLVLREINLTLPASDIPDLSFNTADLEIRARPNGLFGFHVESAVIERKKGAPDIVKSPDPYLPEPSEHGVEELNYHLGRVFESL